MWFAAAGIACIAFLAAVLGAAVLLAQVDDEEPKVFGLEVGDCFNNGDGEGAGVQRGDVVSDADIVDCDEPHDAEVHAMFELDDPPGAPYPGSRALNNRVRATCDEAFEEWVGVPYEDSTLESLWLLPQLDDWDEDDDRLITCIILPRGAQLSSSMKDSRR